MLEDYCDKIKQIQRQKNAFLRLKYKETTKEKLQHQQEKYHKYILMQISYKDKLNSIVGLTSVIEKNVQVIKNTFFKLLKNKQSNVKLPIDQKKLSKSINRQNQINFEQKSVLPDLSVFKLEKYQKKVQLHAGKQIFEILISSINRHKIVSYIQIKTKVDNISKLQRLSQLLINKHNNIISESFQLIRSYQKPRSIPLIPKPHLVQNSSYIFSLNEFSEIMPYTIQQQLNESSLSLQQFNKIQQIDSKFDANQSKPIKQSVINNQQQLSILLKSMENLRNQVIKLKELSRQKSQQLKLKDEQISKIKKQYQAKIQSLHDQISEKMEYNFSLSQSKIFQSTIAKSKYKSQKQKQNTNQYLKQLQNAIIGDRAKCTRKMKQEPVDEELIQKYMQQAFLMREQMDIARQLCGEFVFNPRSQQGQVMLQIIRLLTPEERKNIEVD